MNRRSALAAALAAGAAGCGRAPQVAARRPSWPALPVRDFSGRRHVFAATGRPQVVNFWALWCPPCRAELPALERLADALAPRGIAVTALALAEDAFAVREYLGQHAARLSAAVLDPKLPLLRERLAIDALPQTFVVTADGGIAICWVGARDWDSPEVRTELARILPGA